MAKVEIWVPLIWDESEATWTAEMPAGMQWEVNDTTTPDLDTGENLTSRYNLIVDESKLPAIRIYLQGKGTDYILFDDGLERDRLLVEMTRTLQDKAIGTIKNTAAESFFNAIPGLMLSTSTRKREAKDVLIQAVARGVDAQQGQDILTSAGLPTLGQTSGIDSEVYEAAQRYIQRSASLAAEKAAEVLERKLASTIA